MNMNKRFLLFLSYALITIQSFAATVDTLYYDDKWKGVETPQFASYMRILYYPSDSNMPKKVKDFYITGELQGEGNFISINKYDDSKSVFDGDNKTYYKSGKLHVSAHYSNGVLNGDIIEYYPNGNYKSTSKAVNGHYDGYYYSYSEDNRLVYATLYKEGVAEPYYHKIYDKQEAGVFNTSDNSPILTRPVPTLAKKEKIGEIDVYSYFMNGIRLTANMKEIKDYGKYYRVYVLLTNYTNVPIEFGVSDIEATILNKKGTKSPLKIYTADEYVNKIGKKTALAKWYHNTNELMNAAQAGKVTVQTQVNGNTKTNSSTLGSGSAYNNSGSSAYGNFNSQTNTTNNYSGTATTTITDYAAAYEAQQVAQQNIDNYNENLESIKKKRYDNYIHQTAIQPYNSLIGYINIDKGTGVELDVNFKVNGQVYQFDFPLNN